MKTILKTTNYNLFKLDEKNRYDRGTTEKKNGFKDLVRSIDEKGQIEPIIVNQNLLITNGETRFRALKLLNLPVIYTIEEMTKAEAEQRMLQAGLSKKWSAKDVANFWNISGKKQYGKLLSASRKTGLPLSYLSSINEVANDHSFIIGSYEYNNGLMEDFDENTLIKYSKPIEPLAKSKKFSTIRGVVACYAYSLNKQGFANTEKLFQVIANNSNKIGQKITKTETIGRMTSLGKRSKYSIDFPSSLGNR